MGPPAPAVCEAKRASVSPPKTMVVAASRNIATPSATLPPVATRMLSLLKKMPDPMEMPTMRLSAVARE